MKDEYCALLYSMCIHLTELRFKLKCLSQPVPCSQIVRKTRNERHAKSWRGWGGGGGKEEERHRAFSIQRSLEQAMFIQSTDFFCLSNPPRVLAKTFQDFIHRLKSWVTITRSNSKTLKVPACDFVYLLCLLVCLP